MPMPYAPIGILQDFRPIGKNMRIDEPLWPVVRETARQILRVENLVLAFPDRCVKDFEKLLLDMSDFQPAKVTFPSYIIHSTEDVKIHQNSANSSDESLVAYIGLTEPDINVRWVIMIIDEGWGEILIACRELLEAGYPGCIGCGGPNSELPWNEVKNRANLP